MSETLHLLLRPAEGALLRLLGTVQRRGFELAAVRTTPQADGALWLVELRIAPGPRDVGNLRRQIEKLYDVERFVDAPFAEEASA